MMFWQIHERLLIGCQVLASTKTYKKICFSPRGARKRSGTSGRWGSGEGFFMRAGFLFGRTDCTVLTACVTTLGGAIGTARAGRFL